jgi:L-amino acid N-acyltransferase YncA
LFFKFCKLGYFLGPSVMSSIYLNPKHTGKGIGEKLYAELIDNLRNTEEVHRI